MSDLEQVLRRIKEEQDILKKRMPMNPKLLAQNFYSLQALTTIVNDKTDPTKHSHLRLQEDVNQSLTDYSDKLQVAFLDYGAQACLGEVRHARDQSMLHLELNGQNFNPSRDSAYHNALKYEPIQVLNVCEKIFRGDGEAKNNNGWGSSFGGKKWENCAISLGRYGKIAPQIYCDTIFSLSHNTDSFLNKNAVGIFDLGDSRGYKKILDLKFGAYHSETILREFASDLSNHVMALLKRAIRFKMIDFDPYLLKLREDKKRKMNFYGIVERDNAYEIVVNYKPANWSKEKMNYTVIDKRAWYREQAILNFSKASEEVKALIDISHVPKNGDIVIPMNGSIVPAVIEYTTKSKYGIIYKHNNKTSSGEVRIENYGYAKDQSIMHCGISEGMQIKFHEKSNIHIGTVKTFNHNEGQHGLYGYAQVKSETTQQQYVAITCVTEYEKDGEWIKTQFYASDELPLATQKYAKKATMSFDDSLSAMFSKEPVKVVHKFKGWKVKTAHSVYSGHYKINKGAIGNVIENNEKYLLVKMNTIVEPLKISKTHIYENGKVLSIDLFGGGNHV